MNIRLGEVLLEQGYITDTQLKQVLDYQEQSGTKKRIGELLIELGYITEKQKLEALGKRLNYEIVDLKTYKINQQAVELIPKQIAQKYNVISIGFDGDLLIVALNDPLDFYGIEDIKLASSREISIVLADVKQIDDAIDYYYSEADAKQAAINANENVGDNVTFFEENFDDEDSQVPVVRLLNSLLVKGYNASVSDIHIEPFEKETIVRMRTDGMLLPYVTISSAIHQALVARTKILAHLDIAEKRLPQDGHFKIVFDGVEMNIRVSIIPTVYGEKVVLRYLNSNTQLDQSETFGMNEENYRAFQNILKNPNGIIYITGPTGSGKTTTLYMVLEELSKKPVNIATIEDPVERNINGVNQMQINTAAGLTFETGLRALLRQDPDIIMIGETRDNETAMISARAAITGHLVFSTLHTNDAISSVVRLRDMGLPNYLVANAVVGIVAQRLARKICPNCCEEYDASVKECEDMDITPRKLKRGCGCHMCGNTGYKGRIAIHEVFELDGVVKKMIADSKPVENIYQYMEDVKKMPTLRSTMKQLVLDGVTTYEEYIRITYNM